MPDLIRHPETFETAGFRISLRSSGMTMCVLSSLLGIYQDGYAKLPKADISALYRVEESSVPIFQPAPNYRKGMPSNVHWVR